MPAGVEWVRWPLALALLCALLVQLEGGTRSDPAGSRPPRREVPAEAPAEEGRAKVQDMFEHAYGAYMRFGFPKDEVLPLSCEGADTLGGYAATLVDALDTLAVMGRCEEFAARAEWVAAHAEYDTDRNVSVFETNIRVLGGLLSAHHVALHPRACPGAVPPPTAARLLDLAEDLGGRLLRAFHTRTHMPYGTVNLRHGVPPGETPVTAAAGVGTFAVEFEYLSARTRRCEFADAARHAVDALHARRTGRGLVGTHIDTKSGQWTSRGGGIGSYVDSYFEYLLKGWLMTNLSEYGDKFVASYRAVMRTLYQDGSGWYGDHSGNARHRHVHPEFGSLAAFWPGLQVLVGDIGRAAHTLHTLFGSTWLRYGCIPERYNWGSHSVSSNGYSLRPEVAESLFYLYRATKDDIWRRYGMVMIDSINDGMRAACGFAAVSDVKRLHLRDHMESFFLAETLKYLYLLFAEEDHWLLADNVVFSTEAHLFPVLGTSSVCPYSPAADTDVPPVAEEEEEGEGEHDGSAEEPCEADEEVASRYSQCPVLVPADPHEALLTGAACDAHPADPFGDTAKLPGDAESAGGEETEGGDAGSDAGGVAESLRAMLEEAVQRIAQNARGGRDGALRLGEGGDEDDNWEEEERLLLEVDLAETLYRGLRRTLCSAVHGGQGECEGRDLQHLLYTFSVLAPHHIGDGHDNNGEPDGAGEEGTPRDGENVINGPVEHNGENEVEQGDSAGCGGAEKDEADWGQAQINYVMSDDGEVQEAIVTWRVGAAHADAAVTEALASVGESWVRAGDMQESVRCTDSLFAPSLSRTIAGEVRLESGHDRGEWREFAVVQAAAMGCVDPEEEEGAGGVGSLAPAGEDVMLLVPRGGCSFIEKAHWAWRRGAAGVMIFDTNNYESVPGPFRMSSSASDARTFADRVPACLLDKTAKTEVLRALRRSRPPEDGVRVSEAGEIFMGHLSVSPTEYTFDHDRLAEAVMEYLRVPLVVEIRMRPSPDQRKNADVQIQEAAASCASVLVSSAVSRTQQSFFKENNCILVLKLNVSTNEYSLNIMSLGSGR